MNLKLYFGGEPKAVQSFRYTKSGMRYQPSAVTDKPTFALRPNSSCRPALCC